MKKFLFVVVALLACSTLFALDLSSVKKAGKDQGKGMAKDEAINQLTKKLKNVQNEKGPIMFKTGSADIDVAKCKNTLDSIVSIINNYPGIKVQVDGHTDNVGNPKANLDLSQKRSDAVVKWLVTEGKVAADLLSGKGFGDTKPIADNKTKPGQAKNRRVDFTINK